MKNKIVLLLITVTIILTQRCDNVENDYMKSIPEGMHLLSQVITNYDDHTVIDTFYYNSNYEISKMERRDGEMVSQFYFHNKQLGENKVTVNEEGRQVSYYIHYMNNGNLSVSNDTTAYILEKPEAGYYTLMTCYKRKPFEIWNLDCSYNLFWESGNLKSVSTNRDVRNYKYDDKQNPTAGYIVWGFLNDDLYSGTTNNRLREGYQYEYNEWGYPVRLFTPLYYREYYYIQ